MCEEDYKHFAMAIMGAYLMATTDDERRGVRSAVSALLAAARWRDDFSDDIERRLLKRMIGEGYRVI